MVEWTKKKIFINDTIQITLGKFLFVLAITSFQFLGLLCDNGWILTGSMFFLIANAFFAMSKSTKIAEQLVLENKKIITELKAEVLKLKERLEN